MVSHRLAVRFGFLVPFLAVFLFGGNLPAAPDPIWQNLSSKRGEIPLPRGGSTKQTGAGIRDFDGDGVNDFILSFRQKPPTLVWYRLTATGWDQYIIQDESPTVLNQIPQSLRYLEALVW